MTMIFGVVFIFGAVFLFGDVIIFDVVLVFEVILIFHFDNLIRSISCAMDKLLGSYVLSHLSCEFVNFLNRRTETKIKPHHLFKTIFSESILSLLSDDQDICFVFYETLSNRVINIKVSIIILFLISYILLLPAVMVNHFKPTK